jgi:predicted 2-oxoglutarate/Fe(II)-dependent dioxygenase YbiX
MNELKDYILILDNIIPDTLCDDVLNEYINSNEWTEGYVNNGKIDKQIRDCTTISLSMEETINKNKNIRKKIDDDIFKCVEKAIKQYKKKFNFADINKDTGYTLIKYEKNCYFNEHIDTSINTPRVISCSFVLNNNFKGGDISFFNDKYIYSLKKGSAIIFPSNFLYPHSVLPVTDGTRYSVITWFI